MVSGFSTAMEIRNDFNFGITFNEGLRRSYNISPNSVVVFTGERFHTKYEPKWYSLEIKVSFFTPNPIGSES